MEFFMLLSLKLPSIANSFLLNISECENFSTNKYENANFLFISRENFMLSMKNKVLKARLLCFSLLVCCLSFLVCLLFLFGVIGRLWSVIVSMFLDIHYYLTVHANCFHVKSCFLRKIKKEKKNVSIFHLLKNYQACGFMAFSTTMYIALIACILRASFFGYTYLNAPVKVFAKRGRGV